MSSARRFKYSTDLTPRWYTVQVMSGMEQKAKSLLEERIERLSGSEFIQQVLLPMEKVVEIQNNVPKITYKKFFPGYLLIEAVLNEAAWLLVKGTPHILGFLGGTGDQPQALKPIEVARILNRIEENSENPTKRWNYKSGDLVKIIDGPFTEFTGLVDKIDHEKRKVSVLVTVFGRNVPIDLDVKSIVAE